MWPFNKTPKRGKGLNNSPTAVAPCGKQKEHDYWTQEQSMACPVCAGIEYRKQKGIAEDRMAEKIAAAVVRQLKESDL